MAATEEMEKVSPKVLADSESDGFHAIEEAMSVGIDKLVPQKHSSDTCIARHRFSPSCEREINNAINVAWNMSYTFAAMSNYFNKDCVALKGLRKFYLERGDEEMEDAVKLCDYMMKKGGCVRLKTVCEPPTDFSNADKGDAAHAMELTLAIEKIQYEKYIQLVKCAEECGDEEMVDYLTDTFLHPQVILMKKHANYVSQLRRVGKGHGHWHWDKTLAEALGAQPIAT